MTLIFLGEANQIRAQEAERVKRKTINGTMYVPDASRNNPAIYDPVAPPRPPPMAIMANINPKDFPIKISAHTDGSKGAAAP